MTVSEILNTFYEDILVSEAELTEGDRKTSLETVDQALKDAERQLNELILGIIGEDEDYYALSAYDELGGYEIAKIRNQLRAEQRLKQEVLL